MSGNPWGGIGDLELLRLWQDRGDEGAFEEVYARRKSLLSGVLMRFLKNEARVEDALQEVWLRIVKTDLRVFTNDQHFRNTLILAARQVAIDLIRRELRIQPMEFSSGQDGALPDREANEP